MIEIVTEDRPLENCCSALYMGQREQTEHKRVEERKAAETMKDTWRREVA